MVFTSTDFVYDDPEKAKLDEISGRMQELYPTDALRS